MSQPDPTYPPLDTPKRFAEDVWIVDSGPINALGLRLPVRMTAIRLADGSLLLHSPTRYAIPLRQALEVIGPIRHLVLPNMAHWTYARDWQKAVPDAILWAAPGVRERRQVQAAGLQIDRELGAQSPRDWVDQIAQVAVPGGLGFVEIVMFHRPSRTLVVTDIVQNLEAAKLPPGARLFIQALGGAGPEARPPVYLRALVKFGGGEAAREAARRLIALGPERIIVSHGRPIERDGTMRLKQSLKWLTG